MGLWIAGLVPLKGMYLVCRLSPQGQGVCRRQGVDVSLSLRSFSLCVSLPPFHSLYKPMGQCPRRRVNNNKNRRRWCRSQRGFGVREEGADEGGVFPWECPLVDRIRAALPWREGPRLVSPSGHIPAMWPRASACPRTGPRAPVVQPQMHAESRVAGSRAARGC